MFNEDKYHWTEDKCTEQGKEILKNVLGSKSINLKEMTGEIYLAQRMGSKKISYVISLILEVNGKQYNIRDISNISEKEEVDASIREDLFEAQEQMKKQLAEKELSPDHHKKKIADYNIPHKQLNVATLENYTQCFLVREEPSRIIDLFFNPELVPAWSNGKITPVQDKDNGLTFVLPFFTLRNVKVQNLIAVASMIMNDPASENEQVQPAQFKMSVQKKNEDESEVKIEVKGISTKFVPGLTRNIVSLYFGMLSQHRILPPVTII